jgi:hypothetical protein
VMRQAGHHQVPLQLAHRIPQIRRVNRLPTSVR